MRVFQAHKLVTRGTRVAGRGDILIDIVGSEFHFFNTGGKHWNPASERGGAIQDWFNLSVYVWTMVSLGIVHYSIGLI